MKPKHKVVTRSPHRVVGLVACKWMQPEPIEYESQLERRFIQRMLVTPGVVKIIDQPFQVTYGKNQEKSYTPDFLLIFSTGEKLVIEVKPRKFVDQFKELFDSVTPILREKNLPFIIATDQMIDTQNTGENIALLLRYARSYVPEKSVASVIEFFKSASETATIAEIMNAANVDKTVVLHMLGRRFLTFKNEISLLTTTHVTPLFFEGNYDNVCIPNWLNAATWDSNAGVCPNAGQQRSTVRRHDHTPKLHVGNRQSNG